MTDDPTYTVFIRVPIPRGDFVDPPSVSWDASKDEALWNILSTAAHTQPEWAELAAQFDVPLDFFLQQVAYLTERHASQVRAQVRKATAAAKCSGATPVSVPSHIRTASALSFRRDSPVPIPISQQQQQQQQQVGGNTDTSGPATPVGTTLTLRPNLSRNGSGATIPLVSAARKGLPGRVVEAAMTQQQQQQQQQQQPERPRLSSLTIPSDATADDQHSPEEPLESSSAASSSSSAFSGPQQSRIFNRRPPALDDSDQGTDPFAPAFLQRQGSAQDLGDTLRGDPRSRPPDPKLEVTGAAEGLSQTSDESTSSMGIVRPKDSVDGAATGHGQLSPRRAELPGRSPGKGKWVGLSRESSVGTPSMSSSFSDLDDASVTMSALEELVASRMQDGGTGSRVSFSQFRNKGAPKK